MKDNFFTPEICLAAVLLSRGFQLSHVSKEAGADRVQFVFPNSDDLLLLVQLFWQKQVLVNVHTFYENLKFLKARLRNETPESKN